MKSQILNFCTLFAGLLPVIVSAEEKEIPNIEENLTFAPPPCGLVDVPYNTSLRNPYVLPTISDELGADVTTWDWPYYGSVNRASVVTNLDSKYLTAKLEKTRRMYRSYSNKDTISFVRSEKRREMLRSIALYCDDSTRVGYFFKIPVQDMTKPRFEAEEYSFTVTPGWNRERPISEGQFVIVSDNAFELGEPSLGFELSFEASVDNVIDIKPVKLWSETNQMRYYYRLDLFLLKDDLQSGDNFKVIISAKDQFHGGTAKINVNVS